MMIFFRGVDVVVVVVVVAAVINVIHCLCLVLFGMNAPVVGG